MKKLALLTGVALLIGASTFAQETKFTKGTKFIEMSTTSADMRLQPTGIMFYKSNNGGMSLVAGGTAGYFVADNVALKSGAGYTYIYDEKDKFNSNIYAFNAGIELFIEGKFNVEMMYSTSFGSQVNTNFTLSLKSGYAYVLNNNFVLNPFVQYNAGLNEKTVGGFGVGIGIKYLFK